MMVLLKLLLALSAWGIIFGIKDKKPDTVKLSVFALVVCFIVLGGAMY